MINAIKNIFAQHTNRSIICVGIEFFDTANDSSVWCAHNLNSERHKEVVDQLAKHGLVFSAEQISMHTDEVDDCPDCFVLHMYTTGNRTSDLCPNPQCRGWKVSCSSNTAELFQRDLAMGRKLYESSAGKVILENHGITGLNLGPVYDISYLAMYNKARLLGGDDDQGHRYGFIRGNVHSFFASLVAADQIIEFSYS